MRRLTGLPRRTCRALGICARRNLQNRQLSSSRSSIGHAIGAPPSSNRHLKVQEFLETLSGNPNRAELWMLVSLRLLNALEVRIKLKPKAYCTVLDILISMTIRLNVEFGGVLNFPWQRSTRSGYNFLVPIVSVEIWTSGAVVTERQRQGQRPCSSRESLYSSNPPLVRN